VSAAPVLDPPSSRAARALLADRTFGPYFTANLVSNVGQWFQNLTAATVVFTLTGSSFLVGLVAVAQFGAILLLSPWAGALSDRVDRRRLLLGGQALAFASAAVLAAWVGAVGVEGLGGLGGPWPVLGATLGMGIGLAFSIPAMQALVPALVPPADLERAVALNSVTFNLARAVGPALAGVVLVTAGPAVAFAVNAATYVPLLVVLMIIRPRPVERRADADRSLGAGWRHVRSHRDLGLLLAAVAGLGIAADPVNTLTPGMAAELGGGEGLVAAFVAAFGSGAAVMAFAGGRLRSRLGLVRGSATGLAVLAAGMVAFAASPAAVWAVAALAAAGAGFLMATTSLTTLLQQRVPEDLRGRIMALWGVAFLGSRPIAATFDGTIADLAGVRAGVVAAASLALLAAALPGRAVTASKNRDGVVEAQLRRGRDRR